MNNYDFLGLVLSGFIGAIEAGEVAAMS